MIAWGGGSRDNSTLFLFPSDVAESMSQAVGCAFKSTEGDADADADAG